MPTGPALGPVGIQERQVLANVELHVYPPLSYRMSSQRVGILVLRQTIQEGEALGDLLDRLCAGDPEAWQDIYDAQARQVKPIIATRLNGRALPPSTAAGAPLADGDRTTFQLVYGGG